MKVALYAVDVSYCTCNRKSKVIILYKSFCLGMYQRDEGYVWLGEVRRNLLPFLRAPLDTRSSRQAQLFFFPPPPSLFLPEVHRQECASILFLPLHQAAAAAAAAACPELGMRSNEGGREGGREERHKKYYRRRREAETQRAD